MKFFEINLLGVYIAPISLLLVAAWFVTVRLRLIAGRFGLLGHARQALLVFAVYIIALSVDSAIHSALEASWLTKKPKPQRAKTTNDQRLTS